MNTKRIGNTSEARVLSVFVLKGWSVCLPFGDTEPYDMVIDRGIGKGFERVQVKTGTIYNGCVSFRTSRTVTRAKGNVVVEGYEGEADIFAVYCKELDAVYLVSVSEASQGSMRLRVEPTKNNQDQGVNRAEDYLLKY